MRKYIPLDFYEAQELNLDLYSKAKLLTSLYSIRDSFGSVYVCGGSHRLRAEKQGNSSESVGVLSILTWKFV